jgi:hypothetical protein
VKRKAPTTGVTRRQRAGCRIVAAMMLVAALVMALAPPVLALQVIEVGCTRAAATA